MNIALVTDKERLAPLCPGAKFRLELNNPGANRDSIEMKAGWYPLIWGLNLKQHEIKILLCAGVEGFVFPTIKGILQQCGIQLVPIVSGTVHEVIGFWRSGKLIIPESFKPKPQASQAVRKAG